MKKVAFVLGSLLIGAALTIGALSPGNTYAARECGRTVCMSVPTSTPIGNTYCKDGYTPTGTRCYS